MYLITGGAGFIGSHLIDRLIDRGDSVVCLDDLNAFYDPKIKLRNISAHRGNPQFVFLQGDIRDPELLTSLFKEHSFRKVIHLAARTGVRQSLQDPALYEDVNVRGTLNLLEQSRKNGVEQFVFASSSSIYGNSPSFPFREDDPTAEPISPYATTKYTGELLCYAYHLLYNIPVAVLRFFSVYGPRQRPDMAIHRFVRSIRQKRAVPVFGDGGMSRDYTYIDDIIEGTLAAIDRRFPFETFNLGNSSGIPLSKLVETLQAVCDQEVLVEMLPTQPGDVERTCADISRARTLLGYNPATNLQDGLSKFVRWFDREVG